jgi:hypothetical protein
MQLGKCTRLHDTASQKTVAPYTLMLGLFWGRSRRIVVECFTTALEEFAASTENLFAPVL